MTRIEENLKRSPVPIEQTGQAEGERKPYTSIVCEDDGGSYSRRSADISSGTIPNATALRDRGSYHEP